MRKVLITRFAAFGDHIHATHLPRLLKEKAGFDFVAFEYNPKGYAIHKNNPFIDKHIHFDPHEPIITNYPYSFYQKRWKLMMEEEGYEKHINLQESLEVGFIAMENRNEYYLSNEWRRKHFGKWNYYDQTSVWAGYPEWKGEVGELYFDDEEVRVVLDIYEKAYAGKFVIICNLSGTSKHKLFLNAEKIIRTFLHKHQDAVCILVGDEDARQHLSFEGERIVNRAGTFDGSRRYPFRQSMLMAKFADMTIGCESGLMVASTLLGTPSVQLMTAASIKNHGGDFKNDYSLQAPCECSPCHKGPYEYFGCKKFDHLGMKYPVCIQFDIETVLNRMEEVYEARKK